MERFANLPSCWFWLFCCTKSSEHTIWPFSHPISCFSFLNLLQHITDSLSSTAGGPMYVKWAVGYPLIVENFYLTSVVKVKKVWNLEPTISLFYVRYLVERYTIILVFISIVDLCLCLLITCPSQNLTWSLTCCPITWHHMMLQ